MRMLFAIAIGLASWANAFGQEPPKVVSIMTCQINTSDHERAGGYYNCGVGQPGAAFMLVPNSPGELHMREAVGKTVVIKLEVLR